MINVITLIRKIIPKGLFPKYHYLMAFLGALIYRFPSREIKIVGITGTKGKTSTAELVNAVLEAAGHTTALAGTLRFKIDGQSEPNLYKMTMPGRFFIQKFLRRAVNAGCDWAVLEMTSQGVPQYRHKFIDLDALIFTNLAPEHIESHGSYENYLAAKLELAKALEKSKKENRTIIANTDDKEGEKFLAVNVNNKFPFSIKNAEPYVVSDKDLSLTWKGQKISSSLKGTFNIYNILAAITFAESQNIPSEKIKSGIAKVEEIKGRVEEVKVQPLDKARGKQSFGVFVDYAHTPDSLFKLYQAFKGKKIIAVLGNTGGGRDKWKRPKMAQIADTFCDEIILTNEDPYDEDPKQIIDDMAKGMKIHKPKIIMDRREAIREALRLASLTKDNQKNTVVLISGKGTDPYIMGPNRTKTPWSDPEVSKKELLKLLN